MALDRYQPPGGPWFSSDSYNDGVQTVHRDRVLIADQAGNVVSSTMGGLSVNSPDVAVSGTINANDAVVPAPAGAGALVSGASTAGSYVAIQCPGGDSSWTVQLLGANFGTGGTVYFEASLDSTNGQDGNWTNINGRQTGVLNTALGNGATTAGIYRGNTSAIKWFRVRIKGATVAPSIAVNIQVSAGTGAVFLNASIPGGSNTIGAVNVPRTQTLVAQSEQVVGATADVLITAFNVRQGVGTPVAAQTSIPITANRGLRITSIVVSYMVVTATTPPWIRVRLRHNTASGTIALASPMILSQIVGPAANVLNHVTVASISLPFGGLDIPPQATAQSLGFSQSAHATTPANGATSILLHGYEYAA